MDAYTPAEALELCSRAGVKKANTRIDKIFFSAVYAGMVLSFGAATHLSIQASPWFQTNAPGLIRAIGAFFFPYGIVAIVLTGAELATGTFFYTTLSFIHGRITIWKMLMHWVIVFLGNPAGSLFMVAIIFGWGGVFDTGDYVAEAINFATTKQVTPQWHQIFLRGIGCNWCVCLALYFGMQGRDLISKIAGIWWPITIFVACGFDHVVANMFFIPTGIWHHTPGLTVGLYIWKGIIPAGLGNIIGGGLFVAGWLWYMHIEGQPEIAVLGTFYEAQPVVLDDGQKRHGILRYRSNAVKQDMERATEIGG